MSDFHEASATGGEDDCAERLIEELVTKIETQHRSDIEMEFLRPPQPPQLYPTNITGSSPATRGIVTKVKRGPRKNGATPAAGGVPPPPQQWKKRVRNRGAAAAGPAGGVGVMMSAAESLKLVSEQHNARLRAAAAAGGTTDVSAAGVVTASPDDTAAAVVVPLGWQRLVVPVQDSVTPGPGCHTVVYVTPSGHTLRSHADVTAYLLRSGTCKCGLQCPLVVGDTFNFDATRTRARAWSCDPQPASDATLTSGGTDSRLSSSRPLSSLTNLCNHRRKLLLMADLHNTHAAAAANGNTTTLPPPHNTGTLPISLTAALQIATATGGTQVPTTQTTGVPQIGAVPKAILRTGGVGTLPTSAAALQIGSLPIPATPSLGSVPIPTTAGLQQLSGQPAPNNGNRKKSRVRTKQKKQQHRPSTE